MPYNKSLNTVENMKEHLDALVPGAEVKFQTEEPNRFAYYLREAIHAAQHHGLDPYQSLSFTFKARPGIVIAVPKKKPRSPVPAAIQASKEEHPNVTNPYDVVGIAQESAAKILEFPDYSGDLEPVQRWASAKGYSAETKGTTLVIER